MSQQPPDRPTERWQPPQQPTQPLPPWGQQPTQPHWGPPPGGPPQPPPEPPYGQQPGWGPPPQRPKPRRPWYLRWWSITIAVLAVLFIIGTVAGDPNPDTTSRQAPTTASPDTSPPAATQPPATEAPTTAAPAAPRPQTISGRGKTATKAFTVEGGMTVFRFQHRGQSNFIVGLLTSRGEEIDGLVNEIGTINGSTARAVEAGRYLFNVEADGPWSIRIEQPRPSSGRGLPATAKGRGHTVAGPFQAAGAGVRFELRHRGESNFIVDALDVDGQTIGNLSNEIGTFEGSTVGEVPEGVFWLNVQADGSWTVTMRSL